jgi:hypothetical protein
VFGNIHYTDESAFKCTAEGLTLTAPEGARTDLLEYEVTYTVDDTALLAQYNAGTK